MPEAVLSLSSFLQNLLLEEGLPALPLELVFDLLQGGGSMLAEVAVLLLDLFARLMGEVLLDEGEISAETDNQLTGK